VPGDLHFLHGGERPEQLPRDLLGVLLHPHELVREPRLGRGEDTELPDTIQELDDGGFERENDGGHGLWLEQRRGAVQAPLLFAVSSLRVTVADGGKARHGGALVRSPRVPVALPALVIALVVVVGLVVRAGFFPGAPHFSAISDDDFARVTIAQRFAAHPRLDPSGTSWLPFPFWAQGAVFLLFGRSLLVAQVTAVTFSALSAALLLLAGRRLGLSTHRAALVVGLCFLFPVAPFLAAATVPEVPTAALIVVGLVGLGVPAASSARPALVHTLALLAVFAATASRYETWPMAAVLAAFQLRNGWQTRRLWPVMLGALALAGPSSWMLWNALAHGDALSFLRRVTAFRAHHLETTGIFASYPLALLRDGTAALLLGAVVVVARLRAVDDASAHRDDDPKPAAGLLLVAALASFLFLLAGDLIGGAPTHHPERALFPAYVSLVLGLGALAPKALRAGSAGALLVAAMAVAAIRTSSLTASFPDRRGNLAEGVQLRASIPPGERVLVVRDSYATEATRAAFERVEDLDPVVSERFDRRSTESPLASPAALQASLERHRARYFVLDADQAPLGRAVGTRVSPIHPLPGGAPTADVYRVERPPTLPAGPSATPTGD
jgi:hypothetical protein